MRVAASIALLVILVLALGTVPGGNRRAAAGPPENCGDLAYSYDFCQDFEAFTTGSCTDASGDPPADSIVDSPVCNDTSGGFALLGSQWGLFDAEGTKESAIWEDAMVCTTGSTNCEVRFVWVGVASSGAPSTFLRMQDRSVSGTVSYFGELVSAERVRLRVNAIAGVWTALVLDSTVYYVCLQFDAVSNQNAQMYIDTSAADWCVGNVHYELLADTGTGVAMTDLFLSDAEDRTTSRFDLLHTCDGGC